MTEMLSTNRERIVWLTAGLLTLIWLVIYLTTVSPTVNFIDSGELITAVREPGVAHPPGYPLYVLLGYVASHVLWGEEAWRVNVLSAFWGALAVGAFVLLTFRLSEYVIAARTATAIPRTKRSTPMASKNSAPLKRSQQGVNQAAVSARKERQPAPGQGNDRSITRPEEDKASPRLVLLMIAGSVAGASLIASSATFWSRTAQAKMYSLHFFFVAVILILALGYRRAYERQDEKTAARWLIFLAATLGLSFTNHLMTVLLVIPVALMLLMGEDASRRLTFIVRRLAVLLPAFLLPLLLYLYLPIRASEGPIMNWGTPDTWGDFWRHISGWQFSTFLLSDIGANITRNSALIPRYAGEQWGFLSLIVIAGGFVAGALLFRVRPSVLWPTFVLLVLTLFFSLIYGISEIEPYMTPFYAMLAVWIGLAPVSWFLYSREHARQHYRQSPGARNARAATERGKQLDVPWLVTAVMGVAALGSIFLVYPQENFSNNRLAEQFVLNVFNELPENSIVITDYWDFYAPTYYLQIVKGVRQDVVVIDKSLLRYPWYTTQLRLRYPWLIENSNDIVASFSLEQRKWVNGEYFDSNALTKYYFDLLTSFVERNAPDHPAYMLISQPCPANQQCEESQIAPTWTRVPLGLVDKLVPQGTTNVSIPPEPTYVTDGITTNPVGLDDAARLNSVRYVDAYRRLAVLYSAAQESQAAQRMTDRAAQIEAVLQNR